ncbi:MAG: sugar phosphate isomerase/epimerase family protein [Akkermansiaceae bacterium]
MTSSTLPQRIAVCSWSLQAATPRDLAEKLQATGISRVQLALDPLREEPAVWGGTEAILKQAGITIVSGMFGCVGEDYSTLDTIRQTGGIAPDETWEQNLENIRATVKIATELGLTLVTFHAGFVPHDPADPDLAKMVGRLKTVAEIFAAADMSVGLETGQETADGLAALLGELGQSNVIVNFDPANMLLYGKGDPIEALRVLAPWIRQVHVKDANESATPGTWGEEVAVGDGQVDWPSFFATLADIKFTGDIVIEREAAEQRVADIRTAREVVLKSIR